MNLFRGKSINGDELQSIVDAFIHRRCGCTLSVSASDALDELQLGIGLSENDLADFCEYAFYLCEGSGRDRLGALFCLRRLNDYGIYPYSRLYVACENYRSAYVQTCFCSLVSEYIIDAGKFQKKYGSAEQAFSALYFAYRSWRSSSDTFWKDMDILYRVNFSGDCLQLHTFLPFDDIAF